MRPTDRLDWDRERDAGGTRRALGLVVGLAPVWGLLIAASVLGEWWYGLAMMALLAAVAGCTFLGMWIGGEL